MMWMAVLLVFSASSALGQVCIRSGDFWSLEKTAAPTDGYVLTYSAATGCFTGAAGGGALPTSTPHTPAPTPTPQPTPTPIPDELPSCTLDSLIRNGTASSSDPQCTDADATIDASGNMTLAGDLDMEGTLEVADHLSIDYGSDPANGRVRIDGPDAPSSTTVSPDQPGIEAWVDGNTHGPAFQIYVEDGGTALNFGVLRNKYTVGLGDRSTNSTANFQIKQFGDRLVFLSAAGKTAGTDYLWGQVPISIDAGDNAIYIGSVTTHSAPVEKFLTNSVVFDAGSISSGACTDPVTTITVTGAADGDFCQVTMDDNIYDTIRLVWDCYVASANTVNIRACNVGSSASNPPSGTYRVLVTQVG